MRKCLERTVLLAVLAFALALVGCSGDESTPADVGVDGDGNREIHDGPVNCTIKEDCRPDQSCIGGLCQAGTPCSCNSNCDKNANQVCDRSVGLCQDGVPPINCITDCDCFTNEICKGAICVPSGETTCNKPEECGSGRTCKDNKCVPKTCTSRKDCASVTCLVCGSSNECVTPPSICRTVDDCCVGYHCDLGACTPDKSGCRSNDECKDPMFSRCKIETGECVPECLKSIDCLSPKVCVENKCKDPLCKPEDCAQAQWCDPALQKCVPGCDANDDCFPPETCNLAKHVCAETDCCGGVCTDDQYCDKLLCQCAKKCTGPDSCSNGFTCDLVSKVCKCVPADPDPCPVGSHCDPQGDCIEDVQTCTSPEECGPGMICNTLLGICQSLGKEGDLCLQDTDCETKEGLVCDNCLPCTLLIPDFLPSATCRLPCSLLNYEGLPCPGHPDRICSAARLGLFGFEGLCLPPPTP